MITWHDSDREVALKLGPKIILPPFRNVGEKKFRNIRHQGEIT